jgi:hypothetical protein
MIVIRSLTAAGLALGGAAFWFAVTDAPSTTALPPLDPPMVSRSVQLVDVSFPLTASLTNCVNNGAGHCVNQVIATNACAAAASNDYGEMTGASDASLSVAQSKAKNLLQNQQGAKVIVSGCSNGQAPPPPPDQPPPPPAPKLGPTVSWNPVLGGLQAHITDRSGVSSQCTYATDYFNRGFGLPANSTYDLRIVPAVPQFRNWNVTITCDNGTTTQASTYF